MGRKLAAAIVGWAVCSAQDTAPIRVDVRLINISFSARDTRGAFVANLTKDDFEVLDDGVPQAISFFARSSDLPLTLGLLADVSGSQEHFIKRHEKDLQTFLKNVLTDRDQAFLLCFGNRLRLVSDFTTAPKQLMDALKEFDHHRMRDIPEVGPPELRTQGTAFYDALYHATAAKLAKTDSGRRAIVMFSDGEDNSSAHHMLDTIEAAQTE